MESYRVLGLMSGTSLDGLDLALVDVQKEPSQNWSFQLIAGETRNYSEELRSRIRSAPTLSAEEFCRLDHFLGVYYAECVNDFLSIGHIPKDSIDLIVSHGQTIFHRPEEQLTVQIACGDTLAALTGIPVVNDFRKRDVQHGGQGAPLVPIGDFKLFGDQAEAFLNIGGYCNISYRHSGEIRAFDICPGNIVLNYLANQLGAEYDKGGALSRKGSLLPDLLEKLNRLDFYQMQPPKSLGNEWLEANVLPLLNTETPIEDQLYTFSQHIAEQLSRSFEELGLKRVMVSGGGALNDFLMEEIAKRFSGDLFIPEPEVIHLKEAIVFAFLGVLHQRGEANCLASVTGASKNVCGGIYHPVERPK
ncbi:MAG: anhydro-N-acetylmuramic acid kinase [Bacteroidetes bacterium]|nr:MAG: anhydro-N-acetylmuramic acid kinase [Bacteroidota bacterium]